MKITGIITEIFEGTVASGRSQGKPFWAISLDTDEKLTAFKKEFIEGLKIGDKATFEVTRTTAPDGTEYINIAGETSIDVSAPEGAPLPPVNRERVAKNAISALQASVTFIAGALGGTATEEDVVKQAETFFEWINSKMEDK